ncbi:YbaL family putative K(+) efflux transporter [Limoniibacter endophyticus]|uniref:Sodium:proton antiporter n=1 Tax=Limoniibacter endophyticus TaxID=1565040 RepID=A0A8J3DIH3_9HYPH|nr:YbaL family putative K(+) efflux transporter [Limoniibacter endophyticus]GHC70494.1 sodium:proton antiporter [Limoniibacter endophyticus]
MTHDTPLITTIAVGLVLAFIFGAIANRLRLSPLVGYLVAGVVVGPATPGYVADVHLAPELAEIGVILLMFGVGLHFSMRDLLSVKAIAIPGALAQIAIATLLGVTLSWAMGWSLGAGLVYGLALSVASTVVLLRALQERHILETERGRIAVGWLIVEDLAMVMALVLLPALSGLLGGVDENGQRLALETGAILSTVGWTLAKVALFVAIMLVIGRRVIPWALSYMAGTGSRELFTLSVLAVALGIAYGSSVLFGISFALGAFFAGMVLAESELSHRAAEDSLPLRDAFAVLFFVSVGMLFDPMVLIEHPLAVIATFAIIVFGKSIAAYFIVLAFGYSRITALTISASLAQIGEFSFILASLGLSLQLLPETGQDLILAGAILSILVNPVIFVLIDRYQAKLQAETSGSVREAARSESEMGASEASSSAGATDTPADQPDGVSTEPATVHLALEEEARPVCTMKAHTVIAGYGFVGQYLANSLVETGEKFVVIDDRQESIERLRADGIEAITGNAADSAALRAANLAEASRVFVAIPNVFEAGQVIEKARKQNPDVTIIARAEKETEIDHLIAKGVDHVVVGRKEIAIGMIEQAFGSHPMRHNDDAIHITPYPDVTTPNPARRTSFDAVMQEKEQEEMEAQKIMAPLEKGPDSTMDAISEKKVPDLCTDSPKKD